MEGEEAVGAASSVVAGSSVAAVAWERGRAGVARTAGWRAVCMAAASMVAEVRAKVVAVDWAVAVLKEEEVKEVAEGEEAAVALAWLVAATAT